MMTRISSVCIKKNLRKKDTKSVLQAQAKKPLEMFESEKPDVVTLDILMPDIDGISLLRKMKELSPMTPVIMSTAYDYRDDFAVWASEAYIVKSSDLNELKKTIKQLIEAPE